jgi:hypothetical protein
VCKELQNYSVGISTHLFVPYCILGRLATILEV